MPDAYTNLYFPSCIIFICILILSKIVHTGKKRSFSYDTYPFYVGFHVVVFSVASSVYIIFQVGDKVKQGQVVCIIEAMKLMNEIEVSIRNII